MRQIEICKHTFTIFLQNVQKLLGHPVYIKMIENLYKKNEKSYK